MLTPRRTFIKQTATLGTAFALTPLLNAAAEEAVNERINILPYLQNPTADGMTICFPSIEAQNVKVRWGESKKALSNVVDLSSLPISKCTWRIWKARLSGLQPERKYFYQVGWSEDGTARQSEIYSFIPFDPRAPSMKAIVVNDVHDKISVAEALMSHVKTEDFDFSILLGDMWNDPSLTDNARRAFLNLEAYVRLFDASNKPMLFVRGNHDVRGWFYSRLSHLFDFPLNDPAAEFVDQNAYYDFRVGPVWFIAPDSGEDGSKQMDIYEPYRDRQAEWLKQQLATSPHQEAPWRIVTTHIPLYYKGYWDAAHSRKRWESVLAGNRIDLALSGHIHAWGLIPKDKEITYKEVPPHTPPYPVIIGGGPSLKEGTIMFLHANAKNFMMRMINSEGTELMKTHFTKQRVTDVPKMEFSVIDSHKKYYSDLL